MEKGVCTIKYDDFVDLARGKKITNESKKKWEKKFDGITIPHRIHGCDKCNENIFCNRCKDDVVLNCHECEKLRACEHCYNLIVDMKTYTSLINNYKRMPEDDNGDMLPIYEGIYQKEYNEIDVIQAINVIAPPRILEEEVREEVQKEEKYLIITDKKKICNTCGIELNDQNKIKDKRILRTLTLSWWCDNSKIAEKNPLLLCFSTGEQHYC